MFNICRCIYACIYVYIYVYIFVGGVEYRLPWVVLYVSVCLRVGGFTGVLTASIDPHDTTVDPMQLPPPHNVVHTSATTDPPLLSLPHVIKRTVQGHSGALGHRRQLPAVGGGAVCLQGAWSRWVGWYAIDRSVTGPYVHRHITSMHAQWPRNNTYAH